MTRDSSKGRSTLMASSVELARCGHCNGLHLVIKAEDVPVAVCVLDAKQWADLFMGDDAFAAAVAARLGRK